MERKEKRKVRGGTCTLGKENRCTRCKSAMRRSQRGREQLAHLRCSCSGAHATCLRRRARRPAVDHTRRQLLVCCSRKRAQSIRSSSSKVAQRRVAREQC